MTSPHEASTPTAAHLSRAEHEGHANISPGVKAVLYTEVGLIMGALGTAQHYTPEAHSEGASRLLLAVAAGLMIEAVVQLYKLTPHYQRSLAILEELL